MYQHNKLNHCEVVAVHDNMCAILWTRYFMDVQGYPLKPSEVHQDNLSSKLLETHMNMRYFFIADVIEREHRTLYLTYD